MAFSLPSDPSDGQVAPASWGDAVRAGLSYLANPPTVRVKNSGTFSHNSSGNWLQVTWNQEDYDTASMHSTSSNTSRLVAPDAGKYRIWGYTIWDGNTTGIRAVRLLAGGATDIEIRHMSAATTFAGVQALAIYAETSLSASEYVELGIWQDSGGTRTIAATSRFGMSWYSL